MPFEDTSKVPDGELDEVPWLKLVGSSPIATISIGGVAVEALVDGGSQVSTITADYYEQHLKPNVSDPKSIRCLNVQASNGLPVPYNGYVVADVCIGGVLIPQRGFLISNLKTEDRRTPVLLGTNVLDLLPGYRRLMEELGCHEQVVTPPPPPPPECSKQTLGMAKVSGSWSTFVPARSLCWVNAYRAECNGTAIIEACKGLPHGIVVASAVCEEKRFKVPVINFSENDVMLNANSRIGILRPVSMYLPDEIEVVVENEADAVVDVDDSSPDTNPVTTTDEVVDNENNTADVADVAESEDTPVADQPTKKTETTLDEKLELLLSDFEGTDAEREVFKSILQKNRKAFAETEDDVGFTWAATHRIQLVDDSPVNATYRRIPPNLLEEIRAHLLDLLRKGVIVPSSSPYSSAIVIVRRKNGKLRLCCDYRALNAKTVRDVHPLPRIEESMDALGGAVSFCCLDLAAAYNQMGMHPDDQHKTAFTTPFGLFEWTKMSFGLTNAPSSFQRLMNEIFREEIFQILLCYLDDILVYGKTVMETLERLDVVLGKLVQYGLKLEITKCSFMKSEVTYLGHRISKEGIATDPNKIAAVRDWPVPQTLKELRSYLGFTSYYRRYVHQYTQRARCLHQLVTQLTPPNSSKKIGRRKSIPIGDMWKDTHQKAFEELKTALTTAPVLGFPDYEKPFVLETDSSESGLGAVLSQDQFGKRRVIAYASRGLRRGETNKSNYSSKKLELLALKWAVTDKFRDYLTGAKFTVYTDNNPMTYLMKTKRLSALEQRWANALAPFDFDIKFRPGKENVNCDILSRIKHHDGVMSSDEIDSCIDEAAGVTSVPAELRSRIAEEALHVMVDATTVAAEREATTLFTIEDSDLAELQRKDPDISRLIHYRSLKRRPTYNEKNAETQSTKSWLSQWNRLVEKNKVLKRRIIDTHGNEVYQILLPTCLRAQVMESLHGKQGHQMIERFEASIRKRCFWPTLHSDAVNWIAKCERCLLSKMPYHKIKTSLGRLIAKKPLEVLAIDFTLLERPSDGKENVLVMTDVFSKFTVAIPTKDQTADTVAKELVRNWFNHYGVPLRIHSDNGKSFEGQVIAALCRLYGIKKTHTTIYRPESNGICERFNRTMHDLLRPLEAAQKKKWPQYLPELVQSYNASVHASTGYSPHFLLFGTECRLPIDLMLGTRDTAAEATDAESWVKLHRKRLEEAHRIANIQLEKEADRRKRLWDEKAKPHPLTIGSLVHIRKRKKGRCKISDAWNSRLYRVVSRQGNNDVYIVVPADGIGDARTLNRRELRPSNEEDIPINLPNTDQAVDEPASRDVRRRDGDADTETETESDTDTETENRQNKNKYKYNTRSRNVPGEHSKSEYNSSRYVRSNTYDRNAYIRNGYNRNSLGRRNTSDSSDSTTYRIFRPSNRNESSAHSDNGRSNVVSGRSRPSETAPETDDEPDVMGIPRRSVRTNRFDGKYPK